MTDITAFPSIILRFDAKGDPEAADTAWCLRNFVMSERLDDLIVLSHGWNNSEMDAMTLYAMMTASLGDQTGRIPELQSRRIGVAGIIWPSKALQAFEHTGSSSAASASPGNLLSPLLSLDLLLGALEEEGVAVDVNDLREVVRTAIGNRSKLPLLLKRLNEALPGQAPPEEDDATVFDPANATRIENHYDNLDLNDGSAWEGGPGGAAGATSQGFESGIGGLLNKATYYVMKRRAARIGHQGVAPVLAGLRDVSPTLRIHLIGHSFGARLQTAATMALGGNSMAMPDSLCLLQAAFSQNSFSDYFPPPRGGSFRAVIATPLVRGPIVVTHTHADRAVRVAYSMASALAGQEADFTQSSISRYGGLGANGAQNADEAVFERLRAVNEPYAFEPSKIFNLEADPYIKNHSDITAAEVAWMIAQLIQYAA